MNVLSHSRHRNRSRQQQQKKKTLRVCQCHMQCCGTVGENDDNTRGVILPCSCRMKVTGGDSNPCLSCRIFFFFLHCNLRLMSRRRP